MRLPPLPVVIESYCLITKNLTLFFLGPFAYNWAGSKICHFGTLSFTPIFFLED
ncbi:hypothetical protein TREPR_0990 [Treponema primitia ZAS-2]|uniref:Uncharacterized protein n=1 Tax=Treponema primitia (strain ATCC BAA-887 / DSM 12427 / ZAS-2) TaxID=545694 RepID=F5YHT2_TREPZ|nr:hypothetical protein TREPR_0990 [Treponema primitia ZAS-2]